jgi:DNA-binding transcriptional ArsR family regulator/uncharacterized protein YndB with AHSA1/START domain
MRADSDLVWKALADPTRRTILDMLRSGPMTTGALTERFEQSRFGVMKHLDLLTDCGLLSVERRGKERWNYLNAARLREAANDWLTPFQAQWASRLNNLDQQLKETSSMQNQIPPLGLDIRQETEFSASTDRVFAALTKDINWWWDGSHRQTGEGGVIVLEPEVGTDMVERSSDGHAVIWGRVEEVRRPDRLYISGRFGVRGAVAGRVHFDLAPIEKEACRLVLSHQAVGAITEEMQANFAAGWRELIDQRLRAHIDRGE